ncbi:C1_2 domain-containing protein [Psidium guajava]|nr:C1_2 domain-containing protein [Psidium guajava]
MAAPPDWIPRASTISALDPCLAAHPQINRPHDRQCSSTNTPLAQPLSALDG